MPRRARRRAPRRRVKRSRKVNPSRAITQNQTSAQHCTLFETVQVQDIPANTVVNYNFSMNDFTRARLQSLEWQFYRAKKVTWTYEPLYNLFTGSGAGALSAPYMYTRMNRTQDSQVPADLFSMQAAGAMPKKFGKTVKITYRPNWNSPGLILYATDPSSGAVSGSLITNGARVQYEYLNSSPYQQTQDPNGIIPNVALRRVPGQLNPALPGVQAVGTATAGPIESSYAIYNGHYVYFDQKFSIPTANYPVARVTMTVQWEFKGPTWWNKITQTNANVQPPA